MSNSSFRMGEFPNAQIGAFDFRGEDFSPSASYFGLELHEICLIAHMHSLDGTKRYHVTRPIMLRTSPGLSFSTSRGDGVYQDRRGAELLRGGTFAHSVNKDGDVTYSGSSGFWSGGTSEVVEASFGDRAIWEDSGRIQLTGRRLGPGMQTYISARDTRNGGICHTGVFYEADGTIFGEGVRGIVILENTFSPPGKVLSDSVIRRRYVGAWNGFASVFEDGTSQHGHITFGLGPFRFANFMDGGRHVCCRVLSVETETGEDGLGKRIQYNLDNGEQWEWVAEKNGTFKDMLVLLRKLGSTTQVHQGIVRRVGETRVPRNYYGIQEWFPERLKVDAIDVEEEAVRGF